MFEKIAKIILKSFIYMFILSFLVSLTNVVPVYLNLRSAANSILISATLNNYITEADLNSTIDTYFGDSTYVGGIICKSNTGNRGCGNAVNITGSTDSSGIYTYMGIRTSPMPAAVATSNSDRKGSIRGGGQVIFQNGFDPKRNNAHAVILEGANGANRGTKMTVRLDTRVRLEVFAFGKIYSVGLPITTGELSAPAMYYYRNMAP